MTAVDNAVRRVPPPSADPFYAPVSTAAPPGGRSCGSVR
jgi:hypothetical protein